MKYETPELTSLVPAINAIQAELLPGHKIETDTFSDNVRVPGSNEAVKGSYEDWE